MSTRRQKPPAPAAPQCEACGEPERLYTAADAAEFLGVKQSWLGKRAAAGLIPAHYVGRYLRFSASDIREIQQAGTRRPVTEHRVPEVRPAAKRNRTEPRRQLRLA